MSGPRVDDPVERAKRIARHHLGDTPATLTCTGPYANEWLVSLRGAKGWIHAQAPTPDEAARVAADQLRAAGWVPTHTRLEWEPNGNRLFLLTGRARFPVATYLLPTLDVLIHEVPSQPWHRAGTVAEMVEYIAGWAAEHLPDLHFPPYPELPHV